MEVDWSGWAGSILECLGDTGTPTGSVACFLETRLGSLNARIGTCYQVSGESGQYVTPGMGNVESGILTEMYICSTYQKKINEKLQAGGCEVVEIEEPDGGRIKIVSKNDQIKTLRGLQKDCCECLNELINWYNKNKPTVPKQTLYNSRINTRDGIKCPKVTPPQGYYSSYNFIFNG